MTLCPHADSHTFEKVPYSMASSDDRGTWQNEFTLETSLESAAINIEDVLLAWEELHPYSVEAVTTQHSVLFDFAASDQCIMFAAIQLKATMLVQETEEGEEEKQPNLLDEETWADAEDALRAPDTQPVHWPGWEIRNTWHAAMPSALQPSSPTEEKESGPMIYTIGVLYFYRTEMASEYNIALSFLPRWRNHGHATPVLTAALEYAFNNLWAHRVQALIMEGPTGDVARTVFTSLGFTFEGTRRRAIMAPAVGGGYRDVISMAMLDTEWHVRTKGAHSPRGVWDEMFVRHHREQEELLQWERRRNLRRTASMETIREGDVELAFTSGMSSQTWAPQNRVLTWTAQ
ncbi:acyl-CoA N-acyltransferase [Daedalea quercina L-15889]|uniref:Acyl-CoA N-acyltransferase n=1 Tax=Daedalea quercina L-15889 TaxID=1314783 RepID=A0A165M520_9APHY|nr:acyl-CoA N-acyltransferase [Daedalea quercina L-15889]